MSAASLRRAAQSWPSPAPEWVLVLARECDRASQTQVAERLGISAAQVNQVLGNAYKGRLDRAETLVRGEYMGETVVCPVLGEMSSRRCLDEQARPYANTNRVRVALYQACRGGCPNFRRK